MRGDNDLGRPPPTYVKMVLTYKYETDEYVVKYYENGKYEEGPTVYVPRGEDGIVEALDDMYYEVRRLRNLGVSVDLKVSSEVKRSANYRLVEHPIKKLIEILD